MTTVQRLTYLVTRDRLLEQIATLPYGWAWLRACSALARLDERLKNETAA